MLSGDLDAIREFLDPNVRLPGGDPAASGACQNTRALGFMRRARSHRRAGELIALVGAGDTVGRVDAAPR